MSTQTETGIDTRLFVGGEFVEAEGGRTFENRDPFTGEVVSEVAAGTRADAQARGRGRSRRVRRSGRRPRPPCGRGSS